MGNGKRLSSKLYKENARCLHALGLVQAFGHRPRITRGWVSWQVVTPLKRKAKVVTLNDTKLSWSWPVSFLSAYGLMHIGSALIGMYKLILLSSHKTCAVSVILDCNASYFFRGKHSSEESIQCCWSSLLYMELILTCKYGTIIIYTAEARRIGIKIDT